jgi:hypothetical protein
MHICGIQIEADQSDPVSLRSRHHPGFGVVALMRNGQGVECCSRANAHMIGHGDFDAQPTLMHYENRARKNPNARWELKVDGPLSGYTLRRIRGQWYVTETNRGFA